MSENFEVEVYSTMAQVEDFISSVLWADMQRELLKWKKNFANEAIDMTDIASDNNLSTAAVLMHLGDLGGRSKAVDFMLALPNVLLQILKDKKEDEHE